MALFKARSQGRPAGFGLRGGLRFIVYLCALLLLAGFALQGLVPAQWVQRQAERHLSQRLDQPVTLAGVSLDMFPLPHVQADKFEVAGSAGPLLTGQGLRLYVDLGGLLRGAPFQRLEMDLLSVAPRALPAAVAGPGPHAIADMGLASLRVRRLGLLQQSDSRSGGPALRLNRMPGERWLLELQRDGETLTVNARRVGRRLRLEFGATAWTFAGLPMRNLTATAHLREEGIELEPLSADLAGGSLRASLDLQRLGDWRLRGSLTLRGLSLEPLLNGLGLPLLRGRADGTLYLAGEAQSPEQLPRSVGLTGELDLSDGALIGIDLQKAAAHRGIGEFAGGRTPFGQLHLSIETDGEAHKVALRGLTSADLQAAGQVRLGADRLDGSIQVRLSSAASGDVPLLVAGTPRAPLLRVDPEAMHGEAWGAPSQERDDEFPAKGKGDPWILHYE